LSNVYLSCLISAGERPLTLAVQQGGGGGMGSVQYLLAKLDITKIDFVEQLKIAIAKGHTIVTAVLLRARAAKATRAHHHTEAQELAELLFAAATQIQLDY